MVGENQRALSKAVRYSNRCTLRTGKSQREKAQTSWRCTRQEDTRNRVRRSAVRHRACKARCTRHWDRHFRRAIEVRVGTCKEKSSKNQIVAGRHQETAADKTEQPGHSIFRVRTTLR